MLYLSPTSSVHISRARLRSNRRASNTGDPMKITCVQKEQP